jgi:hypothetical protein
MNGRAARLQQKGCGGATVDELNPFFHPSFLTPQGLNK